MKVKATIPIRGRELRWLFGAAAILLAAGFLFPLFGNREAKASQFVESRSKLLRACHNLAEAQRVADYTREFPDRTWVSAISEHACSSGAGFDATVFYGSDGNIIVDRSHHFCGLEGLQNKLNQVSALSLNDFYQALNQRHPNRVTGP